MEYQRENNLLKQQIDYLNRKIQEQIFFNEENDKSHEDNINELKMELEETFTNKLTEMLNEKKEYIEKIQSYENRNINLENSEKNLKEQNEILQKKINELYESKSQIQSDILNYKETIQSLISEKNNLEQEKNNLIQENENLISSLNQIENRLKSKIPKTTDLQKRLSGMGKTSKNMVRTDLNVTSAKRRSKNHGNISIDSGGEEKINMSVGPGLLSASNFRKSDDLFVKKNE